MSFYRYFCFFEIYPLKKKLPKNVIKNGKIIPIRSEIEKKFEGVNPNLKRDNDGNIII